MYRISDKLADELMKRVKKPEISSLSSSEEPFVMSSSKSIGIIDPVHAYGTDFDYILEIPYSSYVPEANGTTLQGYWLYRKGELAVPDYPVDVPKHLLDPNASSDDFLDIADCSILVPTEMEKLTCTMIHTLDRLLEKEPKLKECLRDE